MSRLHGLVELEAVLVEQARVDLELRNSQYVDAFRAALSSGLEPAMAVARPYLDSEPPWWYELLTSLLSVELTMDHAKHSLSLMRTHRGDNVRGDGRLLRYHADNWVIWTAALLEKVDHLVCRVYRVLVRRVDPTGYKSKLRVARGHLQTLREQYGNVRNPQLHPIGGPEKAIEEDRLWEPHVLVDATMAGVIGGHEDQLPPKREEWANGHMKRSVVVFAVIDASLEQAVRDIRNES